MTMLPDSRDALHWYLERERRYYGSPEDSDLCYEARGDEDRHTPAEFLWELAAPPLTAPPAPVVPVAPSVAS